MHALRGVDIAINSGDFVSIMGASGSGKSTLMNIIGCLDRPSEGSYLLDGVEVARMSRDQQAAIRNEKIGFVFQSFNLLSRASAVDNVGLPLLYNRRQRVRNVRERSVRALQMVGLGDRLEHTPKELSGGQQQRVAVARALVNDPAIILADEPTGNLDSRTTLEIMELLQNLNEQGITIIIVTHEAEVARYTKRMIELRDGLVVRDRPVLTRRQAIDDLRDFAGVMVE